MSVNIIKIAAFCDGNEGGNPAGVCIGPHLSCEQMQSIAADVGFSETVFAEQRADGWRVRYFSPQSEVPFCGHATVALGAALAKQYGVGVYPLKLNEANVSVEGFVESGQYSAALQSPSTRSVAADSQTVNTALALFGYQHKDINHDILPALAHGGADHLIIALNSRNKLAEMAYDLDAGQQFMRAIGVVTIMFVFVESEQCFHTRNPFASGGVYEDPATGAASAAFAGYLRDIHWPHGGLINIIQGEDMGARSLIQVQLSNVVGASVRVSGAVRFMDESIEYQ